MSAMTPSEINALWGAIVRLFPTLTTPIDFFVSPSSWRLVGTNLIPSLVANKRVRRAAGLLAAARPEATSIMLSMAQINATRAADLFRTVALAYISVPIALSALVSEAAPDFVAAQLRNNLDDILYWVIVLAVTPILYFCMMWRAKQIVWAIEAHQTGALEPLVEAKK
jgi:hypothetical protein